MLCYVTRGTVTRLWCEQRSQSRPEVKPLIPRMASPSPHPLHHYHRQSPNYRRAEIARCLATGLHHWSTGRLSGRSARAVGDGYCHWSTAILFISLLDDDDDSYTSPSQCSPLHLTASWAGPVMNRPGWSNAAAGAINGVKYNQKNLTQTVKRPNLIKIPVSPLPTALAGNVMQSVVSVRAFPFLAFKPTDRRL